MNKRMRKKWDSVANTHIQKIFTILERAANDQGLSREEREKRLKEVIERAEKRNP